MHAELLQRSPRGAQVNQIGRDPMVVMHTSYMGRRQSAAPPNYAGPKYALGLPVEGTWGPRRTVI